MISNLHLPGYLQDCQHKYTCYIDNALAEVKAFLYTAIAFGSLVGVKQTD